MQSFIQILGVDFFFFLNQLVHFFFNIFFSFRSQSFWDNEEGKTGWTICLVVPALHDHTFCVWSQHKHGYLLISYFRESWRAPDLKFYRDLFYDLKQRQHRRTLLDCDMKENKLSVRKIQAPLFIVSIYGALTVFQTPSCMLDGLW